MVLRELTIEQNELTPKLNLRRNYLYQTFLKEIESMYHQEVTSWPIPVLSARQLV